MSESQVRVRGYVISPVSSDPVWDSVLADAPSYDRDGVVLGDVSGKVLEDICSVVRFKLVGDSDRAGNWAVNVDLCLHVVLAVDQTMLVHIEDGVVGDGRAALARGAVLAHVNGLAGASSIVSLCHRKAKQSKERKRV